MIKDQAIAWNVKRVFIPVQQMAGWLEATNLITSLGAGTAVMQEVLAAAQLAGMAIGAAGDEIFDLWKIPWDLDRDQPIQMRIHFFHASTDADTPDWKISMKGISNQQALTAATATPDATLTFPAKAVSTTANSLEKTDWKSTSGTSKLAAADLFAMLAVECNGLGSAGANEITLMGIEIAFTVKATGDSQRRDMTDVTLPASLY
jgi:hypothetical protein